MVFYHLFACPKGCWDSLSLIWKLSTFSFSLNNYTLILNRKRETLNAGLAKTCLPASFLSQVFAAFIVRKTNPLQRVTQERNRTKLTKILGKRDNLGCSFTRQFHPSNRSLLPKSEILLLLHYLLFLLLAPCSNHLPSVGSGSQQLRKLHLPDGLPHWICAQEGARTMRAGRREEVELHTWEWGVGTGSEGEQISPLSSS